jgi:pyruvate ferredoxin oxidoreductase beta subunit/2-oxoisovalerate ferredoxin oxidoreductase beta subunit
MAAHRIPYAATASIAFPHDLVRKIKKAAQMRGASRFIHLFASCPTGWGIPSEASVKIARLAVQTNCFPLYEVEDGLRYTLNIKGELPVEEYLGLQGRFKHLSDKDMQSIQKQVDADWRRLVKRVQKVDLLEQPAVMRMGQTR